MSLLRPCCATVIFWGSWLCDILAKYLCMCLYCCFYLRDVLTQTDKASITVTCQQQTGVRILFYPDTTQAVIQMRLSEGFSAGDGPV